MANSAQSGLRFYGVIDVDSADAELLAEAGVSLVRYRELAAVVAAASYVRAEPGDAELADYVRVVDALAVRGPVVPAPPGTVFRDQQVLARWLDVHYAKLHEALSAIDRRNDGKAPYDYVQMDLGA